MDLINAVLGWSSPICLGVFIFLIAATLFILSKTIQTLSRIDREINSKTKKV